MSNAVLVEASKRFPDLRMELRAAEVACFGVVRTHGTFIMKPLLLD
jgi:hypothetical protein